MRVFMEFLGATEQAAIRKKCFLMRRYWAWSQCEWCHNDVKWLSLTYSRIWRRHFALSSRSSISDWWYRHSVCNSRSGPVECMVYGACTRIRQRSTDISRHVTGAAIRHTRGWLTVQVSLLSRESNLSLLSYLIISAEHESVLWRQFSTWRTAFLKGFVSQSFMIPIDLGLSEKKNVLCPENIMV